MGGRWERACLRYRRRGLAGKPRCCHRRQACSHRFCGAHKIRALPGSLCGSGLARDAGGAVWQANQPHRFCGAHKIRTLPGSFCGSGLARVIGGAVWQANQPHRFCGAHKIRTLPGSFCGSGLARDAGGAVWQANQPHRFCGAHKIRTLPGSLCESEPARDGITAVHLTDRSACITGKLYRFAAPPESDPVRGHCGRRWFA